MLKMVFTSLIFCTLSIHTTFAACNYPLDATIEDYAALASIPLTANTDRTLSTNIQPSTLADVNYLALSHQVAQDTINAKGPFGDMAVPSTGIVAFEMTQNMPNTIPAAPGAIWSFPQVLLDVGIKDPNDYENYIIVTFTTIIGGTDPQPAPQMIISVQGTGESSATSVQKIPLTLPLSNYRFGVYFNQNTKKIGVSVNGTDYGYFSHRLFTQHISKVAIKLGLSEGKVQMLDPIIGKSIGFSLNTDASKMSHAYPKGTTDICGNTI